MDLDFAIRCPLVRPEDASYPVSVRQVAALLHTSFRRHLAEAPLCFANPSPPSGWIGDSHSPAIEHAGHTTKPLPRESAARSFICGSRADAAWMARPPPFPRPLWEGELAFRLYKTPT